MSVIGIQKRRELIRRLTLATVAGTVSWTEVSEFTYTYSTTTSSITVSSRDEDGTPPYTFELFNQKGAQVENWNSHSRSYGGNDDYGEDDELSELFNAIRRQVLNVDALLDDLLKELPPESTPQKQAGGFGSPSGGVFGSKHQPPADDPWATPSRGYAASDEPPF